MQNASIYNPFAVDISKAKSDALVWKSYNHKVSVLPESIKDVLILPETTEFFMDLAIKLNLSEEQSADLSRIVRDILIGDMFIGDFQNNLMEKMHTDESSAENIKNLIISELFKKAIEDIKREQYKSFPNRIRPASSESLISSPNVSRPPVSNSQASPPPNISQNNTVDLRNK